MSLRARTLLALIAALAAATSLVVPSAVADDKRDDLSRTQDRLGNVEAVLRDARANADALGRAVAQADAAVVGAQARLDQARARAEDARLRRVAAAAALQQASDEVRAAQQRLAEQARQAYMTGGMLDLDALVSSGDLSELADRAATLNVVAARGQEALAQLDLARYRASALHDQLASVERDRAAAAAAVRGELARVQHVRSLRAEAKQALDAKVGRLA
ncbi:MAG TPA: hypothetical protein VFA45_21030, partial [Actinomycetes bacterium]|nr:hypothetical protein [Actinomycetes bacterium]